MLINPALLPQVTNRESFSLTVTLVDDETNEALDLTGCSIVFEIRRAEPRSNAAYGPWYDSTETLETPRLSASIDDGSISIIETGVFQVDFTATQMRTLNSGTYEVGCILTSADDDEDVREVLLGRLPVLKGNVT